MVLRIFLVELWLFEVWRVAYKNALSCLGCIFSSIYFHTSSSGSIGITMAPYVKRVVGLEQISQAVEDAKYNAALNGWYI